MIRNPALSRRDACRQMLAAAAALTLPHRAFAGESDEWSPTYVLASSMYGTLPLAEILPEIAATGAVGIDLWPRVHGNQREQVEEMGHDAFRELLDRHSATLYMTTRYDLGPFKLGDELQFVHNFGGKLIVTGAHKSPGDTPEEKIRNFVDVLQPHVARAEELGVTIAIENHANSLLDSPESIRCFAEHVKSEHLGVAIAPYHLPQDPQLLAGLIADLGPKVVHFYAWEHGHGAMQKLPKDEELMQMPGVGSLDFAPILAALRKIDYQGAIQIFMHPFPRGIPILDTAEDVSAAINRSREYLTNLLTTA